MRYFKYNDTRNLNYFYNDKVLILDEGNNLFRWNYQTDWSRPGDWDTMMRIISENNYNEMTEEEAFLELL